MAISVLTYCFFNNEYVVNYYIVLQNNQAEYLASLISFVTGDFRFSWRRQTS